MVSFLAGLAHSGRLKGPVLIVCPATVLRQWVDECNTWWPPLRAIVMHASGSGEMKDLSISDSGTDRQDAQKKRAIQAHRFLEKVKESSKHLGAGLPPLIITTYASIRLYKKAFQHSHWQYVILDEGHKIRNPEAEVTVACKTLWSDHRIIISGTPIQNNLSELWCLFDFIFPGKLGVSAILIPFPLGREGGGGGCVGERVKRP